MNIKKLNTIICALILLVVFFSGCFGNDTNGSEMKILSITQSPENPKPGDRITITVIVESCSGCDFNYESYFAGGSGGSRTMTKIGAGRYETKIGPFDEGTEVWYMVSASGYGGHFIVSDDYTIQIGKVERSSITTLSISNIHQSPQNPTTKDTIVTVAADITSNVYLADARFEYMHFKSHGCGGGGGTMSYETGDTFEGQIYIENYDKGTKIFYRIAAQDGSGNTAVSPTLGFEL